MMNPVRWMAALVTSAVLFPLVGCAVAPVPVLHPALSEKYSSRCVLRPDGESMYSSNYLGSGDGYKPGSTVSITMFSEVRVDLTVNKIPHQMFPVGGKFNTQDIDGFIEKYLVRSPAELDLANIDETARNTIEAGNAAIGMTKEEVYMALGPPPEINFGQRTVQLGRGPIMDANRWIYFTSSITPFWFQRVYTFTDDELVKVE